MRLKNKIWTGLTGLSMAAALLTGLPACAQDTRNAQNTQDVRENIQEASFLSSRQVAEAPDAEEGDSSVQEISNEDLPVPPSVEVRQASVIINKKKTRQLDASVEGAGTEDIVWTSSDKRIATVTKTGKIRAKKVGKVKITARIRGTDEEDTCKVEVVHYKKFRVRATGYCNCARCSGPGHPHTASGTVPKQGRTIAVDRRKIPFGSRVEIKGHMYRAEDCGSAIKGNRIDIYFASHRRATAFGVKYLKIKVYYKK